MTASHTFVPAVELTLCATDDGGVKSIAFDDDLARVCLGVRKTGSLYDAAREAGIAYSHAWKKIGEAEKRLGEPLFVRRGCLGTSLSDTGSELLEAYLEVRDEIDEKARVLLHESMVGFS